MPIFELAAVTYVATRATGSGFPFAVAGMLAATAVLHLAIGLVVWALIHHRTGGEGSDEDDGGPGWGRRRPPRTPPPEPLVSWPDFERQFAEHVASLRRDTRERA